MMFDEPLRVRQYSDAWCCVSQAAGMYQVYNGGRKNDIQAQWKFGPTDYCGFYRNIDPYPRLGFFHRVLQIRTDVAGAGAAVVF